MRSPDPAVAKRREQHVTKLLDFAKKHDNQFSMWEVRDTFGWDKYDFRFALQGARARVEANGQIIPRPGRGMRWMYVITDDVTDTIDAFGAVHGWATSERDLQSRELTYLRQMEALKPGTSGRTIPGKKLRQMIDMVTGRLATTEIVIEELEKLLA